MSLKSVARHRMAWIAAVVVIVNFLITVPVLAAADTDLGAMSDIARRLTFNEGMGWGIDGGRHTALVTALATLMLIVLCEFVCPALTAFDRRSAYALGLVAGGAIANAAWIPFSMGVPDFISLRFGYLRITMNPADIALLVGVAICLSMAVRIARSIRATQRS